jgi:hypothetical protein
MERGAVMLPLPVLLAIFAAALLTGWVRGRRDPL